MFFRQGGQSVDGEGLVVLKGSPQALVGGDLDLLGAAELDRLDPLEIRPGAPLYLVIGDRGDAFAVAVAVIVIVIVVELDDILQMAGGKVGDTGVADLTRRSQVGEGPPGVLAAFFVGEALAAL